MNRECLWGNGSNYNDGNEEGSEEIGPVGCFWEPRTVEGNAPMDVGITIAPRWMERLTQQPFQIHYYYFFRTMPCGTRFASFTLSEQLFLMLSYFSCGIENCWNKWLGNSNCIHSWHWYWQIASFPHWNGKLTRRRHRQVLGREGASAFYFYRNSSKMLWESKIKCYSEIPLESIPCPIFHIRLEIKPIKMLIYNQNKTQSDNWLQSHEHGVLRRNGAGRWWRWPENSAFWWVELEHLLVWTSPPGAGHLHREMIDRETVLWDLANRFARALKTVHMKIMDFSLTFPQYWMPLSSLPTEITARGDAKSVAFYEAMTSGSNLKFVDGCREPHWDPCVFDGGKLFELGSRSLAEKFYQVFNIHIVKEFLWVHDSEFRLLGPWSLWH